MKQFLSLKWRLLPLVVAAFVLSIPALQDIWHHHKISVAAGSAQAGLASIQPQKIEGVPNRILIPSLDIDLLVVTQAYSLALKSWPVAAAVANYAKETPLINNYQGQSLIYGHNNRGVFGPLLSIKKGTKIYIYTANDHIFKYSYIGSQDVTPNKTSIIAAMSEGLPGLRLMTCDGPYFQYRHLMAFKLEGAS